MMPDALVVGPMKAGTTWLYDYLRARGDICLPDGVKETFFFDRHYEKGMEWYQSHFSHCNGLASRRAIEVAPSYFHHEAAPERIVRTLGQIPIIVTLRDPVARSWSHYLHLKRKGYTRANLQQACVEFPEIIAASRYSEKLGRWKECLPEEKIHVFWQEDLAEGPDAYARRLSEVLSVPWYGLPESSRARSNEASVPHSVALASIGTRVGNWLRSHRFYGVVNIAKKIGLKPLFYGTPAKAAGQTISPSEAMWLAELLDADVCMRPERLSGAVVGLRPEVSEKRQE